MKLLSSRQTFHNPILFQSNVRHVSKIAALIITITILVIGLLALWKATASPSLSVGKLSLIPLGGSIPMVIIGLGGSAYLSYTLMPKRQGPLTKAQVEKLKKEYDALWKIHPWDHEKCIAHMKSIISQFDNTYYSHVDAYSQAVLIYKAEGESVARAAHFCLNVSGERPSHHNRHSIPENSFPSGTPEGASFHQAVVEDLRRHQWLNLYERTKVL